MLSVLSGCWFSAPSMTGAAQGASAAGREVEIKKIYTRRNSEREFFTLGDIILPLTCFSSATESFCC